MYHAMDIAKYIVSKCTKDNYPITNIQLQKILFAIQKDYLSKGEAAFYDPIEAWSFGPVVRIVYYHFCGAGTMPIPLTYNESQYMTKISEEDKVNIDSIVEQLRELEPWDLVPIVQPEDGAWDKTYNNGAGNERRISTDLILEENANSQTIREAL